MVTTKYYYVSSTEETFLQDFLEILEEMFSRYWLWKIGRKEIHGWKLKKFKITDLQWVKVLGRETFIRYEEINSIYSIIAKF